MLKKIGDTYKIGNIVHTIDPIIYRNYKEVIIVEEKFHLKCLQAITLLINAFTKFNQNNYCAISGTLLGTYRHQGFIPSDDDFDFIILPDLYDHIYKNLKMYNKEMGIFTIIHCSIGYKIMDSEYGCLGDLFVYNLRDDHYVLSGPVINGEHTYMMNKVFPFCNFHKSIILPFKKGLFENIYLNIPQDSAKCLELNYCKEALYTGYVAHPHDKQKTDSFYIKHLLKREMTIVDKSPYLINKMFEKIFAYYFEKRFSVLGAKGKRTCALTVGCFDLLHDGHHDLFDIMKPYDHQIIIVHDDKSIKDNKNVDVADNLALRLSKVSEYMPNAQVIPVYEKDPSNLLLNIIQELQYLYNFTFIRSDDFPNFPGRPVIENNQIPIILKKYKQGISSTILRSLIASTK